jgi:hypothetical protein
MPELKGERPGAYSHVEMFKMVKNILYWLANTESSCAKKASNQLVSQYLCVEVSIGSGG